MPDKRRKREATKRARLPNLVFVLDKKRVPKLEKQPNTIVMYVPPKWSERQRWRRARELWTRHGGIWDYAQRIGGPGAGVVESWKLSGATAAVMMDW